MIALLRRAFDAKRLAVELEQAEKEIEFLSKKLKAASSGPSFTEVSKEFDASALHKDVRQKVIDDFAPLLQDEALNLLKQGMHGLVSELGTEPTMRGKAAYNRTCNAIYLRFEVPPMATTVTMLKDFT